VTHELIYGVIVDWPRKIIHIVRAVGEDLDAWEIDEIAARMRERMLSKNGEQAADVVVVDGSKRESLRLSGEPYAVSRVRTALLNAAVNWSPITLDD
jgi:hypothetical protein